MKWLVLSLIVSVVLGQMVGQGRIAELLERLREYLNRERPTGTNITDSGAIDTYHGWRLEDHHIGTHHLLLFIKDQPVTQRECYLIVVSHSWDHLLQDTASVNRITEEIFAIIQNPHHAEIEIPPIELADMYDDFEGAQDCRGHASYQIYYSPSFLTTHAP